jgi:murein DD-endopeptidase MepM/ murein hydrolase activator NlpD
VIVRIDSAYVEWSETERAAALATAMREGGASGDVLDRIRGRQVWIDHGDAIVTRYAHLSRVADLRVGDAVVAGDVIGYVGASGLPEGGPHLHFEIRLNGAYQDPCRYVAC